MQALRRFDDGIARGEGAIAAFVLLTMILLASLQAALRNLTYFDLQWANDALRELEWIDQYLKKGTLWLAFLGASLATRDERHIAIDLLPKLLPEKGKLVLKGVAALAASVISFFLARAFWAAVLVNAEERPTTYEVWGESGPLHICDAAITTVTEAGLSQPTLFCALRDALSALGAPVETPPAAMQLIVPIMFVIVSVRLFANGVSALLELGGVKALEEPAKPAASAASADTESASEASTDDDASAGDSAADDSAGADDEATDDASADESAADDSSPEEKS